MNPSQAVEAGQASAAPDLGPASPPPTRARRRVLLMCCVVAIAVKIWLVLAFGMRAAGNAQADDRLFLVLADSILNGDWLGEYNRFTLVKGPFFSIWIATVFLLNIPLTLSYQLFHVFACGLLIAALRPRLISPAGRFALFLLLLFDPSTYSAVASWVVRDGIYFSLTTVALACVIAMLLRLDRRPRDLAAWSVGLGVTLAAFWTTREEGVWILPGAGVALLYGLTVIGRLGQARAAKIALLLLPAVLCTTGVLGVAALNYRYYGVFEVVEMTGPAFKRANGALMRVKHEAWNQFACVPKDVRLKIYAVSPAFAELQEFLEGPPGLAWGRAGETWLIGGTPSPPDIRGGFFVWALRHAAEQRGHHRSAIEAERFYSRIADEIEAACDDGRLDCGPKRASMTPPWRWEYATIGARCYWRGLRMMATWDDIRVFNMPSAGPEPNMLIFEDLGRVRLNPLMGDTRESPLRNQARLDAFRFRVMDGLNSAYKTVSPFVTAAALVVFLVVCALEFRARAMSPTTAILFLLLVLFATRIAILTLVSITSFEAMRSRYFLPLYPMTLLFWFLAFHRVGELVLRRLRKD